MMMTSTSCVHGQRGVQKLNDQEVGAKRFTVVANNALYLIRLAKGDKVVENDKDLWANVKPGLMILSDVVSIENSLYEERGRVLKGNQVFGHSGHHILGDVTQFLKRPANMKLINCHVQENRWIYTR
ncbi:hypothetical protein RHSIM_Rhsim07G0194900 [Rhododendron simsii]|uniref:Uncharacterized protein n=1 Tax=Rhododendron simsii TaxID=118357 RepID=A0A834GNZ8_RHOSS|nr:hypothetical protein RHSIM_Rhsim07G0194900 [Rhododendron simsii]